MDVLVVRLVVLGAVGILALAGLVLMVLFADPSYGTGLLEGGLGTGVMALLTQIVGGLRDYNDDDVD